MKTITMSVTDSEKLPAIRIEDDWLLIEVRYPYHVELKRMNEPWKLERWIEHLESKPWMNPEHLATVTELVSGYFMAKNDDRWADRTSESHPNCLP